MLTMAVQICTVFRIALVGLLFALATAAPATAAADLSTIAYEYLGSGAELGVGEPKLAACAVGDHVTVKADDLKAWVEENKNERSPVTLILVLDGQLLLGAMEDGLMTGSVSNWPVRKITITTRLHGNLYCPVGSC